MTPGEINHDPWIYFGSFSRDEVDGAAQLLTAAKIVFQIQEGDDPTKAPDWKPGGWTGPFSLEVYEGSERQASELLIPYFAARQQRNA